MKKISAGFTGDAALVAGELRGYRQFQLRPDGLYPVARAALGPWDGTVEQAVCAEDGPHVPPGRTCGCGLYGWYHPSDATGQYGGGATAVIGARGRVVLGDKGFRAAAARVVAVTLPLWTRLRPPAAAHAQRMLATRYPDTQVYRSRRRMLRDHPPEPLDALGIRPSRNVARLCGRTAAVLRVTFLAVAYLVILLPPDSLAVSTRKTVFLLAFFLVLAAHLLLAAVALVSRRGATREIYGVGRPRRT